MNDPLNISHDIGCALNRGDPLVALESSVIAHGLPHGVNVETALAMEDEIRSTGAVPATIGVIGGILRVGLTRDEIERLGAGEAAKLAARDLPYASLRGLDGGTTVSATARIAHAAGIPVMATGGIGGVHRGFAETLDVSADLVELARTPVIVVCSGAKAVLDIRATAEWLETHGVGVVGYGTDELPSFYSAASGISIPRIDGPEDAARLATLWGGTFGIRCALVVAVPPPQSAEADVSEQIDAAANDAAANGVRGSELTPWLLARVAELTDGSSVRTNAALLKNNARAAAEIAKSLSRDTQRRMGFVV